MSSVHKDKTQAVIHRPKHDKKPKDIAREPEMKRLKELLDKGQVDPDRLKKHLKRQKEIKTGPLSRWGGLHFLGRVKIMYRCGNTGPQRGVHMC
jgi:hypothetical protein